MNIQTEIIYHIVSSSDFKKNVIGYMYAPGSLLRNGYIHCASGEKITLLVAEDSFSKIEESIYIIKIIVNAVLVPVRFEESPQLGSVGIIFPHIYGSLNLDAVEGIGFLSRSGSKFLWPDTFYSDLTKFI
ncbi:MAG: DUF952 domain-containing protein [Spirochaetales bacterium]|nr:DUF952 domain-containing protein [Spirochaetales bacterium]